LIVVYFRAGADPNTEDETAFATTRVTRAPQSGVVRPLQLVL
jgi:hypothetical protein